MDEDVQPTVYRVTFINQVELRSLLDLLRPLSYLNEGAYFLDSDARLNVWNENLTQLVEMVQSAT